MEDDKGRRMMALGRKALVFKHLLLVALLTLGPSAANGACKGTDIFATLPDAERAEMLARVEAVPYPRGNFWRAERGGSVIDMVGTVHLFDNRLHELMEQIAPLVGEADLVLVELTPEQQAALAQDPSLVFITSGPTLRDLLSDEEWQVYQAEMQARGVPREMAEKLQPWLALITLAIPTCLLELGEQMLDGLDNRIIRRARDAGVPVQGLDSIDVFHTVFGALSKEEALDALRATLLQAPRSEDVFATVMSAYFAGEYRLAWEFGRSWMPEGTEEIFPPDRAKEVFDRLEEVLLAKRNRDWMHQLLPMAEEKSRIVVAVGAAHLAGHDGLLDLLERAGYSLVQLDP